MENFTDNKVFLLLAARNLSGEASAQDIRELETLFDEDDLYKKKFELLKDYWGSQNSMSADVDKAFKKIILQIENDQDESEEIRPVSSTGKRRGVNKFMQLFPKVAAILIVCATGAYFIYQKATSGPMAKAVSKEAPLEMHQTPKGQRSTITLSDGTKVIMNADSRLRFPHKFSGSSREIYLTGEALFDVAHNARVPFIIHINKLNIKVLGTEFNVKSYPDDSTSETTLINGMIEVTLEDRPYDRIILKPREKLIVSNSLTEKTFFEIKMVSPVQSAELLVSRPHNIPPVDSAVAETSWVYNKLVFQNENFVRLAEEIGRKYDVNIQFNNDRVKYYRFSGVFEKETIDEALAALQLTEKFNYTKEGTAITIY